MKLLHHHWELEVHKKSVETSMIVFQESKRFPKEETYSLTDQIRRSSRAVSAAMLVTMGNQPEKWLLRKTRRSSDSPTD
jgi:four helix bundle protein